MSDWEVQTLGNIVEAGRKITYGIVQPGPDVSPYGVPLIRGKDYSSGKVSTEGLYHVLPEIDAPFQRSKVKGGDLLLSIAGYVGKAAIVPDLLTGANLTQTTARLSIDKNRAFSKYVFYVLSSEEFWLEVKKYEKGSAQSGLNLSDVEKFRVRIPKCLHQQKKIAHILTAVDNLIEKTQLLIDKYTAVKQGMMHDLFTRGIDVATGELRPSYEQAPQLYKETELGWVPREWEKIRLSDHFKIKHGHAFDGEFFSDKPPGDVLLTPGNFHREGGLYFEERNTKYYGGPVPNEYVLKNGDLLVVMTDLSPQTLILGRFVLLMQPFTTLHNQRIGKVEQKSDIRVNINFLLYALNQEAFRKRIVLTATGTTVRHSSPSKILDNYFSMPLYDEQSVINNKISALDGVISSYENERKKLEVVKKGLMQDLLTGKVRVA